MTRFRNIFIVILLALLVGSFFNYTNIRADEDDTDEELEEVEEEIEETQDKISDLNKKLDEIKSTVDNLSGSLNEILNTISYVESQIEDINNQISKVTIEINTTSASLASKTVVRDRTVRTFYKKSPTSLMVSIIQSNELLGGNSSSQYLKKYVDDSLDTISEINSDIVINKANKNRLEKIKEEVEAERQKLLAIKADTEQKLAQQEAELAAKNNDLSSLNEKLEGLKAKQQEILAAKSGSFSASLGEGVQTDDPRSSPTYDPGFSPAFAAFSYGGYTHRNGMSQYGAKARAEEGQDYEDIIKFYFKEDVSEKDDLPDNISVQGYGDMSFQEYLYGLAEMPASWHEEALKAQAIAARSYAYRYVKAGKTICTTQSCQVFSSSKSDNPPERWKEAVDNTENKIIGGSTDASGYGWYSSTTGGYINNVGWDVDGSWPEDAYEKKAGTPWFYKAWYTESYSVNSSRCGREHPWLNAEEMADILNAYVILKNGGDTSGISPLTTSCWGGDPDSMEGLREKAEDKDIGFSKVTDVKELRFSNDGFTSSFIFETDKGSYTVDDGVTFKSAFNLRAPGYIAIKTPLFDIRRK